MFGAQAALLYGSTRVTADVDVTVRLGKRTLAELIDCLKKSGFALRVDDPEFFETTRVLPLLHIPSKIPADVVLSGPGLEDGFIDRSVARTFAGVTVFVAAPEDLVVMKVLAGRDKDSADVREILAAHPVDLEQVRSTLTMLEAALDQSDLISRLEHLAGGPSRA